MKPADVASEEVAGIVAQGRMRLYAQCAFACRTAAAAASAPPNYIEFLVRGEREAGGLLPSTDFFDAAERGGLMIAIDRWVVTHAVQAVADLAERSTGPLPTFGINLSVAGSCDPAFFGVIHAALQATGVDPALLCFEISEKVAAAHLEKIRPLVRQLRQRGCKIALDDYGAGVLTFDHFRVLPIDWLKLDAGLIARVPRHEFDTAVVEGIARVCRALGVRTIAEGIESAQTLEVLQYAGVDAVQGYLLHSPEPAEAALARRFHL